MPRRSNDFQKLIRRIYVSITPKGATLAESALLDEFDAKAQREVDVLIEFKVSEVVVRIAVECRDHARVADVQWIDSLIGKYQRLPVDRVVAVSRSGFTAAAVSKALANRIDTRTLKAALETDWPAELKRISVGRFAPILSLTSTEIVCDPPWPDAVPPVAVVVKGNKQAPGAFIRAIVDRLHDPLWPLLESQIGKALDTIEDLDKRLKAQFDIDLAETVFVATAGTLHEVSKMRVHCDLTFEHEVLPVKRHLFGSVGVTTATDHKAAPGPITLVIAQERGEPIGRPVMFAASTGSDIQTG